jgi:predicted amidohydrolase YtcJ
MSGDPCPALSNPSTSPQNYARRAAATALLITFATCAGLTALHARAQTQQAAARTLYFLHGRIYTNDPQHPWASAMAVREGKVACIGGLEIMLECGGGQEGAETIQLGGHFVMPGFNDAHVHLGGAGADMLAVRLNGSATVE